MKRSAMMLGGVAAMQLFGCMSGEIDTSTGEEKPTWEEFRARVHQEPESGVFIVDGDTPIEGEKNLYEFYEKFYSAGRELIVNRVGNSDDAWSATAKLNITYCVSSSSFGSRYNQVVTAMANATTAWEQAGNVNFVHQSSLDGNCTASTSGVVFDVRQVSGQGYLARAFFPAQSRSTRNVLIDSSSFGSIAPYTLTGILRHELGHTLGFRHEHTRSSASGCFEDNNWRALTTTYDRSSVMHYPQCNGTQTGDLVLTSLDRQGTASLYGGPGGGGDPDPDPDPGQQTRQFTGSVTLGQLKSLEPSGIPVRAGTTFTAVLAAVPGSDPDLYVRWGSAPTRSTWNCRPYLGNNQAETCSITVPSGQSRAYVSVDGYTASSYNVTVTYTAP